MLTTSDPAALILALSALVAAVATLWRLVVRPAYRLYRRVDVFLDDWTGTPARPGRARIKGIPERIATVEANLDALRDEVKAFQSESSTDRTDLRARLSALIAGPDPDPDP